MGTVVEKWPHFNVSALSVSERLSLGHVVINRLGRLTSRLSCGRNRCRNATGSCCQNVVNTVQCVHPNAICALFDGKVWTPAVGVGSIQGEYRAELMRPRFLTTRVTASLVVAARSIKVVNGAARMFVPAADAPNAQRDALREFRPRQQPEISRCIGAVSNSSYVVSSTS
jgi:hypothetical protein